MTLEASDVTSAVSSAEAAPSGHRGKNARASAKPGKAGKRARSPRQKRKMPAGIVIVLGLMVMGFLWAAFAPSGRAAGSAANNEQVRLGRALFLAGCSSCHGLNAEGGNQAPSLIGVGAAAVDFQVSTGRMPLAKPQAQSERHEPKYNQTQIDQLAAYIASIAPGPAKPDAATLEDGAKIAEGGELFRTNCASCHQAVGQGGALSYGKHAPALGVATPVQIAEAVRTGPENMPVFGDGQLTSQQLASIIKYVQFVTAPKDPGGASLGHYGPVPEGLVAIIIGLGGLVIATMWIGSRVS
jgi:ubiquinol-cytochrome c reductase cytochrome c subunit